MHTHTHSHTYTEAHTLVCMHVLTHTYTHTHIHTHTHTHTHMHTEDELFPVYLQAHDRLKYWVFKLRDLLALGLNFWLWKV